MKGEEWPIIGYADRFSVPPGGKLGVMVSTGLDAYHATVVRLGPADPLPVDVPGVGEFRGRVQTTHIGSYVLVPHHPVLADLSDLTLHTWIYPTLPGAGRRQGLLAAMASGATGGWALALDESGRLTFEFHDAAGSHHELRLDDPLRPRNWYRIVCSLDSRRRRVRLSQHALKPWPESEQSRVFELPADLGHLHSSDAPLVIGAGRWHSGTPGHAADLYEGKIENPSIHASVLAPRDLERLRLGTAAVRVSAKTLVAAWDFSRDISSSLVTDTSRNGLHGRAVNTPMRATTGHGWEATEQHFLRAPQQWAAIHFHSDDLGDAGWQRDFELTIPADMESGAYAVRLAADADSDDVPFFVSPGPAPRAPVLFIAPTFTYLAYGNSRRWLNRPNPDPNRKPVPADLYLARHPEMGLSLYDTHLDGSGCAYASRLKPIVQMRPDHRSAANTPRHYPADLWFLQWLERKALRYDVMTDEDLDEGGVEALSGYRAVVTGSHPEYYTEAMLDGLDAYVERGGKLMYLGGNGFYWVTSRDRENPHVAELRRGVAGTRDWSSEPGELYHSTTGEFGGLWRHRGRAPQQLGGVGFCAVSGVGASGYARLEGSFDERVAFIFQGVGKDEVIGNFGAIGGGAAGDELDRLDYELGTPPTAILLATSAGLNTTFTMAIEDIRQSKEALNNPRARADMVYFTNPNGGAVFTVGSINWFGSLGHNGDDNNVSRITENVLRNFIAE